jgi:hypothetical protein
MSLDGRAGRGAFRCGCGSRVVISIPAQQPTRCVATHQDEPCRFRPAADAPLPLCEEHYASTGLKDLKWWTNATPPEIEQRVTRLFQERWAEYMAIEYGTYEPADPEALERTGVVYFIKSRDLVKIGTTTDLLKRMAAFSVPHITLLATEPGYKRRERELHLQFADLRVNRREWFRLAPPLTDYIDTIRARHGLPNVDAIDSLAS